MVDESRAPIAGAVVTWASSEGRYFDAVTGADGDFRLGPFAAPVTGVLVRRTGYLARWAPVGSLTDGGIPSVVLLDPHSAQVTVRDVNGPAAGVPVQLKSERCVVHGVTDAKGHAELGPLIPDEYTLRAGGDLLGANRRVFSGTADRSILAPLVLQTFGALEVHLDAGTTRDSYAWVQVVCPPDNNLTPVVRNDGGTWTFGQLPPGDCLIEASRGEVTQTKWTTVKAGERVHERLTLPKPELFKVAVTVLDARGRPADAYVEYAGRSGASGSGGSPLELSRGVYESGRPTRGCCRPGARCRCR